MAASSHATQPDRDVLAGSIERVTFHNAENGFCVLRITSNIEALPMWLPPSTNLASSQPADTNRDQNSGTWLSAISYLIRNENIGETIRFTSHSNHAWCWFRQPKPSEVSMLKCYDSQTDSSASRWSFYSTCIDPTAPAAASCPGNVVVRSFVFVQEERGEAAGTRARRSS